MGVARHPCTYLHVGNAEGSSQGAILRVCKGIRDNRELQGVTGQSTQTC